MAVEKDDTDAMTALAMVYHYGREGVNKNTKKAIELYERAIKGGSKLEMYFLATLCEDGDGDGGVAPINYEKAVNLYMLSIADPKCPEIKPSYYKLAMIHYFGKGTIPQDSRKATEIIKMGIHAGSYTSLDVLNQMKTI